MSYDYSNPNNQYGGYGYSPEATAQSSVARAMKLVYLKMTIALVVTGIVSVFCGQPGGAYITYLAQHSWVMWALIIAQFAIVLCINGAMNRLGTAAGTALFYVYSVLMGLWIAPLFSIYTSTSIAKTFFITAGTFGAMSVYGYTTGQDLSKAGKILFMALIGLIIAMVVNIFAHSTALEWVISIAGVIVFVGLTAWDTQKIKQLAMQIPASQHDRLATMGALSLYLDFINLFLYLLRIFGSRR